MQEAELRKHIESFYVKIRAVAMLIIERQAGKMDFLMSVLWLRLGLYGICLLAVLQPFIFWMFKRLRS